MRSNDLDQIRSVHLFSEMSDASFTALMKGSFLQRFPARVSLINENDRPDFLHVVVEGAVELFACHDSRETTLFVVRPVATFILAAVVGDLPYLASARTLEMSRVLMIPSESVRGVFREDGAFAREIVKELSLSFRRAMKELKNQKLRTSVMRLANWILVAEARYGNGGRFTMPYDKRTLASRLGMTPENLSRNLAQLAEHGVEVDRSDIVIRSRVDLEAFARPAPSIDDRDY
jgi:CRP/FNR family transcriptional activator FtrB